MPPTWQTKRRVALPPPVVIAEPVPPEDPARVPLTDNQWRELVRLEKGPQPTDGFLRRQVQAILCEKHLAVIEGERCRILPAGLARFQAGRRGL